MPDVYVMAITMCDLESNSKTDKPLMAIKIGYTADLSKRIKSLERDYNAIETSILGLIPGEGCLERKLHKKYARYNLNIFRKVSLDRKKELFAPTKLLMLQLECECVVRGGQWTCDTKDPSEIFDGVHLLTKKDSLTSKQVARLSRRSKSMLEQRPEQKEKRSRIKKIHDNERDIRAARRTTLSLKTKLNVVKSWAYYALSLTDSGESWTDESEYSESWTDESEYSD
jgi:hypothetical protein